jgi:hypothetical protein
MVDEVSDNHLKKKKKKSHVPSFFKIIYVNP